jgi:hypothetical protein
MSTGQAACCDWDMTGRRAIGGAGASSGCGCDTCCGGGGAVGPRCCGGRGTGVAGGGGPAGCQAAIGGCCWPPLCSGWCACWCGCRSAGKEPAPCAGAGCHGAGGGGGGAVATSSGCSASGGKPRCLWSSAGGTTNPARRRGPRCRRAGCPARFRGRGWMEVGRRCMAVKHDMRGRRAPGIEGDAGRCRTERVYGVEAGLGLGPVGEHRRVVEAVAGQRTRQPCRCALQEIRIGASAAQALGRIRQIGGLGTVLGCSSGQLDTRKGALGRIQPPSASFQPAVAITHFIGHPPPPSHTQHHQHHQQSSPWAHLGASGDPHGATFDC